MGWCQAIVLVAYFGILQCDLTQTTKCNCNNKPTILQFRIPNLNTPLNYPFYCPLPFPYVNANQKHSDNQKKCSTPKCNSRLQPAAVKISIPTATKSGWANIIIDTRRNPNGTIEDYRPKPQKTNINVFVHVGKSNKTLSSNASEPAVSAKTNVSSTKDANGNHVRSVSSADDSTSMVSVSLKLDQFGHDNSEDSENDYTVNSDSLAKDDKCNVAKSTSTTGVDEKDKNKAKPDSKPKNKDTATHDPTTKNPAAKNPKGEKPVTKEPEAKKPEAEKPEAKKPEAEKPEAKKPVVEEPDAKKPEPEKPEATKPEAEEPVAKEGEKSVAKEAEAEEPVVEKHDAKEPVAEDHVADGAESEAS